AARLLRDVVVIRAGPAVMRTQIVIGRLTAAAGHVLVQQVVDPAVQGQVIAGLEAHAQVIDIIGLVVQLAGDRLWAGGGRSTAIAFVSHFGDQRQVKARQYIPAERTVKHVLGRVNQRETLLTTAFLFAVGVGVVAAQAERRDDFPACCQLYAPGLDLVDGGALTEAVVAQPAPARSDVHTAGGEGLHAAGVLAVGSCVGGGALVVEGVAAQGGVGVEVAEVVVIGRHFIVGAGFRLQVRRAGHGAVTRTTETDDAGEQLVRFGRLVASADPTLERPVVGGAPGEIGARADL